jgi:hypothetical protein
LVDVEVNVILAPLQILVEEEVNDAVGITVLFTVMFIALLVAVCGAAHANELVIITFTILALVNVEDVNVFAFEPAFTPFTCHW